MKRSAVLFFSAAAATYALGAAGTAVAATTWYRSIEGAACQPRWDNELAPPTQRAYPTEYKCAFPSDMIYGTTSPGGNNGVTAIYADIAIGEANGRNANLSACALSYNLTSGKCGAPVTYPILMCGVYSISLPLWTGTASGWDYFWVDMRIDKGGYIRPTGIAVTGFN